jgi:hydrogenase nickel incorporation protein HypA/HybF
MHEWALADAVVTAVIGALGDRTPRSLRSVQVLIGELQAVDVEIFRFGLQTLLEPYGVDAGAIRLEIQAAELACRSCGRRWILRDDPNIDSDQREAIHFLPEAAHAFLRCPYCKSADFEVAKGRGVSIGSIELADPEGNG